MERIQETFTEVGKRDCFGEKDRSSFSALNQLLCGHTRLNSHQAKINPNQTDVCSRCNVPETVEHYLFDCDMYKEQRRKEMSWKRQLTVSWIEKEKVLV